VEKKVEAGHSISIVGATQGRARVSRNSLLDTLRDEACGGEYGQWAARWFDPLPCSVSQASDTSRSGPGTFTCSDRHPINLGSPL
jgi:hypothetical protein